MELFIVKICALIRVRVYLYSLKCYTSSTHCSARIKVSLTQIIKFKLDQRRTMGVKLNILSTLPYNAARHVQHFDHFSIEGKKLSIEISVGRRMT